MFIIIIVCHVVTCYSVNKCKKEKLSNIDFVQNFPLFHSAAAYWYNCVTGFTLTSGGSFVKFVT